MTVLMYDSTETTQIPTNATAVAGYTDGKYQTIPDLEKGWPHAHLLKIAVFAQDDGDCLDVETGDATPDQTPGWFHRHKGRKPVFYANRSTMPQLIQELSHAGITRDRYLLWVADPTGVPHIPAGFDGCQFDWKALGRNLDASIVPPEFFDPPPKPNTWQLNDEINWCREFDRIKSRRTPAAFVRRLFLRHQMLTRRKLITRYAHVTGWHVENRLYRYQQLAARTG